MLITEFTKPADRKDIDSALQPFLDFIKSGEEIPIKKIRNKLYRALKPIGIDEIDILRSKNVDVGDMNMNGAYDPHDDEDEFQHFSLELIFSETDETIAFSKEGVENIKDITEKLEFKERFVMLDHDDLYSNLLKSNISSDKFPYYVNNLIKFCKSNNITLLRTIGIIFSDENKNISDYIRWLKWVNSKQLKKYLRF